MYFEDQGMRIRSALQQLARHANPTPTQTQLRSRIATLTIAIQNSFNSISKLTDPSTQPIDASLWDPLQLLELAVEMCEHYVERTKQPPPPPTTTTTNPLQLSQIALENHSLKRTNANLTAQIVSLESKLRLGEQHCRVIVQTSERTIQLLKKEFSTVVDLLKTSEQRQAELATVNADSQVERQKLQMTVAVLRRDRKRVGGDGDERKRLQVVKRQFEEKVRGIQRAYEGEFRRRGKEGSGNGNGSVGRKDK